MNSKMKFYIRAALPYLGLVALLGGASLLVYSFQVRLFHDLKTTEFYLLQDLAFLPLQVLLGVLIIERILSHREKKLLLRKLNMVIGVFFSECGTGLLALFTSASKAGDGIPLRFAVSQRWTPADYDEAQRSVRSFHPALAIDAEMLASVHRLLSASRERMLGLLENPNLLEHERFTDLLWVVTHLAEELDFRESLHDLTAEDIDHLKGDMLRAYRVLVLEWLSYMRHLQKDYPFLFSLAVRKSPFAGNHGV